MCICKIVYFFFYCKNVRVLKLIFFFNVYMMFINCMVRFDNIKWFSVFVFFLRRVINLKILLFLMFLFGYIYVYIIGEINFFEIYYFFDNYFWVS